LIDDELATFFEVERSTISLWKRKHKDFFDAIVRGKTIADTEVAESLFKRAKGYEYEEIQTYTTSSGKDTTSDNEDAGVKRETKTKKQVAPDPTAAIFWLKNRRSKDWRDKQDIEMTGEVVIFKGDDSLED
jgi:hypothetical protein